VEPAGQLQDCVRSQYSSEHLAPLPAMVSWLETWEVYLSISCTPQRLSFEASVAGAPGILGSGC
jgi:hypothetical protein